MGYSDPAKEAARNARVREEYAAKRAAGQCTKLGCSRAGHNGGARCAQHRSKDNAGRRERGKPWYMPKKQAGLCVFTKSCQERASDEAVWCEVHRRVQADYQKTHRQKPRRKKKQAQWAKDLRQRRYWQKRCYRCGSKDLASESLCWEHLAYIRKVNGTKRGSNVEAERPPIEVYATAGLGAWDVPSAAYRPSRAKGREE